MTKLEARELSIEMWQYLADHPEIDDKRDLPYTLRNKIKGMISECPLCEINSCDGCPLYIDSAYCWNTDSPFGVWNNTVFHDTATRKQAAQKIVDLIKAWNPEDGE